MDMVKIKVYGLVKLNPDTPVTEDNWLWLEDFEGDTCETALVKAKKLYTDGTTSKYKYERE